MIAEPRRLGVRRASAIEMLVKSIGLARVGCFIIRPERVESDTVGHGAICRRGRAGGTPPMSSVSSCCSCSEGCAATQACGQALRLAGYGDGARVAWRPSVAYCWPSTARLACISATTSLSVGPTSFERRCNPGDSVSIMRRIEFETVANLARSTSSPSAILPCRRSSSTAIAPAARIRARWDLLNSDCPPRSLAIASQTSLNLRPHADLPSASTNRRRLLLTAERTRDGRASLS